MDDSSLISNPAHIHEASWIWDSVCPDESDIYRRFRKIFTASAGETSAEIEIAADSDFVAWLDGVEIARGQFSDYADRKTFGTFRTKVLLQEGENILAILVYYRGQDFSSYQKGTPGVIASLHIDNQYIRTDDTWKTSVHPAFRAGHREVMSQACGFTFQFDARHDEDWITTNFDDTHWKNACVVQEKSIGKFWQKLTPRPLPSLQIENLQKGKVVLQGNFLRHQQTESAAQIMALSALHVLHPSVVFENFIDAAIPLIASTDNPLIVSESVEPADGRFFIVDLGAETVGLLEFCVDAPAGTILEIAHGEHLDDGRVRMYPPGIYHFADRYICRGGIQSFQMPFRRLGARFLEIHITGKGKVLFHALGLRPTEYPTERKGSFASSDMLSNHLHQVAVRTLELCRHEHYEDCPWREQALYAYDGRLQALYGYYAFGDYQFPAVSFGILGDSYRPDWGLLTHTAPSRHQVTIPIFSLVWISAVMENWLYSGESTLFDNYQQIIVSILGRALDNFDKATGLYNLHDGEECWHYYEWTKGLHEAKGKQPQGTHHAAYNLHLLEALQSYTQMLRWKGELDMATQINDHASNLRASIHRAFWDESAGFYRSEILPDGQKCGAHELIQALALYVNIVPTNAKERLRQSFHTSNLAPCTLSASYYLLRAIMQQPIEYRDPIYQRLSDTWNRMIFAGATSLWETEMGSRALNFIGSLCHAWSSLPVYFHQAISLGVVPTKPGFETFRWQIDPLHFEKSDGVIPTPSGNIAVHWHNTDKGLIVEGSGPPNLAPQPTVTSGIKIKAIKYNGQKLELQG